MNSPEEQFRADPYGFIVRALHGYTLDISYETYLDIIEEIGQHLQEVTDGPEHLGY